jgi:hypothetical protein
MTVSFSQEDKKKKVVNNKVKDKNPRLVRVSRGQSLFGSSTELFAAFRALLAPSA